MCITGYSGNVIRNNLLSTIDTFGPEYRVAVDIKVHSGVGAVSGWSHIIRFTSTSSNCCNVGDRVPGIFYHSSGKLQVDNAVNGNGHYFIEYDIDLEKWYHVEIVQAQRDGKVRKKDFWG